MNGKLRIALVVLFSAVLVFSGVQLARIGLAYKQADDIYAESRAEYVETASPAASDAPDAPDDGYPAFTIDVAGLRKQNPDVIGWLYIPDTNVSYPLVRGGDNQKYLHMSYDGRAAASGSIFMDFRNTGALTDDNSVIYGHNMKNGSMFGGLKKYADTAYLKAHADVFVFLSDRVLRFRAFAGYKTEDTSESYTLSFADGGTDFAGFLDYIKESAGEKVADAPDTPAPLLTLSTCTSTTATGRFVVEAVYVGEKSL